MILMNYTEVGFLLIDFSSTVYISYVFLLNDSITKCDFFADNFTNKERMNCWCWSPISPFACQAG